MHRQESTEPLLSALVHELCNPLFPMAMEVRMLLDGELGEMDAEARQAIQAVERNLAHLRNLVSDMRNLLLIPEDPADLQPQRGDLAAVVRDVAVCLRSSAEGRQVRLDLGLDNGAWAVFDGSRIHQVLYNVLGNAIKFSPRGGTVTLGLRRQGPEWHLRVRDEGPGFTPEQLEGLFQPFRRLHGASGPEGTGLGLHLSQRIMDLHGGAITCQSDGAGRGSCFTVVLPVDAGAPTGPRRGPPALHARPPRPF